MDVILTLDYELFNGPKGGSIQNCLLTPTFELLKILGKYDFRATFFVDVCFLLKMKSLVTDYPELEKDWLAITSQISKLSECGHDVELHIHPNWYRATYSKGFWESRMDDYKLSDLSSDVAENLFREGIALLSSLTGKQIHAFRAGAYCLQTYKSYPEIFRKYDIFIDSSVFRNRTSKTKNWEWYDYTNIPSDYNYSFSDDVCRKQEEGDFMEVSIPSYRMSTIQYLFFKCKSKRIQPALLKGWGDGKTSIGGTLLPWPQRVMNRLTRTFSPHNVAASIDGTNVSFLDFLYRKELNNGGYFLIMGHPKLLSPYSINGFDAFLRRNMDTINNITIKSFTND